MRRGYAAYDVEDPRLDFEAQEPLSAEAEKELILQLDEACREADVLCVSDQFEFGCVTPRVRERVCEMARGGLLTVVDSRHRIGLYRSCILKPNEIECARAIGREDDFLSNGDEERIREAAAALAAQGEGDVCLTLGAHGSLYLRDGHAERISAIPTEPPVDTVGAGDCFLSAFSLATAAGATPHEAGVIGALASAVCVKKLNTTGTATREELISLFDEKGE
jgi:sugar/nucleoside kinase (ribokinase family)